MRRRLTPIRSAGEGLDESQTNFHTSLNDALLSTNTFFSSIHPLFTVKTHLVHGTTISWVLISGNQCRLTHLSLTSSRFNYDLATHERGYGDCSHGVNKINICALEVLPDSARQW